MPCRRQPATVALIISRIVREAVVAGLIRRPSSSFVETVVRRPKLSIATTASVLTSIGGSVDLTANRLLVALAAMPSLYQTHRPRPNNMIKLIYLAAPYTDPIPGIRIARTAAATHVAAQIIEKYGYSVFSPITHGHELAQYLPPDIHSHEFWMGQCLPVLRKCNELWVLQLEGWGRSSGVAEEIAMATEWRIPIRYITPGQIAPTRTPCMHHKPEKGTSA